ncbi:MAG: hypothetical protein RL404_1853 [Pseudomonadota bacterium]
MSTHRNPNDPPVRTTLAHAWRALLVAYETANRITHHALGWLMAAVVVAYFAFCAAFLGLRYLVLPNIDNYKPEVEQMASHFLRRPVSIQAIDANWNGLNPRLTLDNFVIHDQGGARVLVLPQVNATISWLSVLGQLRLQSLEVIKPDLEIERDENGHLFVAGLQIDTSKPDDGRGLDWLLAQHEIVIREGWLRWRDLQRQAPDLVLTNISFVLKNQWRTHRAAFKATPPEALAAPLDVRAEFTRPPFSGRASDASQWSGELFVDWHNASIDAWKPYIDLPWELAGGNGAVRAWLNFNRMTVANFTADLSLVNLSARLAEGLEPLNLKEVSGRVSAGEPQNNLKEKIFSFGAHGHVLTLTDFSLRTEQGLALPRTTVSHRYTVAAVGRPEQHELKIGELDLEPLAALAAHLPLSPDERQMLEDYAPRGELHDFSANWQGPMPGSGNYQFSGRFSRLSIKPQLAHAGGANAPARAAVPGFDGLSGDVDATQDGGRVRVKGERATLYVTDYLVNPTLFFDELALDGSWSLRNHQQLAIKIGSLEFLQGGLRGRAEGTHLIPLPFAKSKPGELDLKAYFPTVELTRVAGYLPPAVGPDARDWLAKGLIEGRANDVALVVKGDLAKFPFATRKGDKQEGVFRITGKVAQARVLPDPDTPDTDHRTPLWPRIDDIEGSITLDRNRLQVHADSARTAGIPLSAVDVVIPDFMANNPVLDISGNASGSLQAMLSYVNASPIADWIDGLTDEARTLGNARVALKMQVPLAEGQPVVQGSVKFLGNEVQLWRSLPAVQQVNGELGFSDKGVQLNNVQGNLLGGPLVLSGGVQRDGSTLVKLDGAVTADGMARYLTAPGARKLMRKVTGTTRYSGLVRVRNQRAEITVESSLAGMAIDLPAPLQKAGSDSMPLKVSIMPVGLNDTANLSEEIRVNVGRAVSARYLRQRTAATRNAPWKVVRGGIGVNASPPMLDSGVSLAVSMASLNLDAWRSLGNSLSEGGSADTGAGSDFGGYLSPDTVNLRVSQLNFADRTIENALIGATRTKAGWQFNLQSDEVIGHAVWEDPLSERGAGKLTARLTLLHIEQSAATQVADILGGKKSFSELPGLDVTAENFELRGLKMGRLELTATNAGLGAGPGREWRISKLAIANPDATMRANGRWMAGVADGQTSLNYEIEIGDAGKLLDRLGFERTLKGGKGRMDGEVSWRGAPSSLDFPTLAGNLNLKLATGQFLKADPGVAKLLGVLSLQALPRRLTLDFRDIFSDGFQFDSIASTATITRGILKTDTFKMRGVNAVVLMDGTVDLNDETQNLSVVVIPELNAGGASVVYGLAVNPVLGLGSFLAQFFLKNPLSQALTQEYQITGPWKDPVIKKATTRRKIANDADKDGKAEAVQ